MKNDDFYNISTEELLLAIRNENDEKAFQLLYDKYKFPLFYFFKSLKSTLSDASISDLIQETFLTVYRYISRLKNIKKFESWLYSIARSRFYDLMRKNKRHQYNFSEESFLIPDKKNSIAKYLIATEVYEILNSFITILKPVEVSIFIKKVYEYKTIKKISEELELTHRKTQYKLEKIYKKLKKYFKKKGIYFDEEF